MSDVVTVEGAGVGATNGLYVKRTSDNTYRHVDDDTYWIGKIQGILIIGKAPDTFYVSNEGYIDGATWVLGGSGVAPIPTVFTGYAKGSSGTRAIATRWPVEEGLTAGTQKQTGRQTNLVAVKGSLIAKRKKEGL